MKNNLQKEGQREMRRSKQPEPKQTQKEQIDKATAPSNEDWEGGASRPENKPGGTVCRPGK